MLDNEITIYSDDTDNLKLALAFKQHSLPKAKAYKILPDGTLILYWHKVADSTEFMYTLEGLELYPILTKHLELTEPSSAQYNGDGSNSKGFKYTTQAYGEIDIPDAFYVTCIFKPIWIYYGK